MHNPIARWSLVASAVVIVALPFLGLANFSWYTPLYFGAGLAFMLVGALLKDRFVIGAAIALLVWTFAAPFLLLFIFGM